MQLFECRIGGAPAFGGLTFGLNRRRGSNVDKTRNLAKSVTVALLAHD